MAFSSLQSADLDTKNVLVVDNSVMMRWLFNDGSSSDRRYARGILNVINKDRLQVLVPYIWVYESAFVVNYYVGEGALGRVQAAGHLKSLFDLCTVAVEREPPEALFEFSSMHGISAYDAAYLMLAGSLGGKVATLDRKIRTIARKLGLVLA